MSTENAARKVLVKNKIRKATMKFKTKNGSNVKIPNSISISKATKLFSFSKIYLYDYCGMDNRC